MRAVRRARRRRALERQRQRARRLSRTGPSHKRAVGERQARTRLLNVVLKYTASYVRDWSGKVRTCSTSLTGRTAIVETIAEIWTAAERLAGRTTIRWTSNISRRSPNRTERRTMADYSELTPVNIITGFLGSGKTTLLQRLLRVAGPARCRQCWSTNSAKSDSIIICCRAWPRVRCCWQRLPVLRGARRPAAGVARSVVPEDARRGAVLSPSGDRDFGLGRSGADRLHAVVGAVFRHHFRLSGIVTTVDAVNGAEPTRPFCRGGQTGIAWPTGWSMTKADLADEETMAAFRQRLRRLNVSAQILDFA